VGFLSFVDAFSRGCFLFLMFFILFGFLIFLGFSAVGSLGRLCGRSFGTGLAGAVFEGQLSFSFLVLSVLGGRLVRSVHSAVRDSRVSHISS
jgi:hypothetical protein